MSALPNQSARLDFRLSPEQKSLIERAARITGQTVSGFATTILLRAAEDAIERETHRTLSDRDAAGFLAMLDSAEGPNDALKAAAERYKARRGA
jgi:uncharacterized protein (DUF1778 family)